MERIEYLVRISFDAEHFDESNSREYLEKMLRSKLGKRGISIQVSKAGCDGLLNVPVSNAEIWIEELDNRLVISAGDPDDADMMSLRLYCGGKTRQVKDINAIEITKIYEEEA